MEPQPFHLEPDIRKASTLPARFYRDETIYQKSLEQVFARSWQWVASREAVKLPGQCYPFIFLPGSLEEPLLLTRDQSEEIYCMGNVCTHRGNLLVPQPCRQANIRCRYHGRRFSLNGQMESSPGFEKSPDFPQPKDHLTSLPIGSFARFLFTGIQPDIDFSRWIGPVEARVGHLPWDDFLLDSSRSRDYLVKSHWALYVENYLEGFHIPFIHPDLAQTLDGSQYQTELFAGGSLQIGIAREGEISLELPTGHPDAGKAIAAWYFWLFPNLMLNFYPWGLSINIVKPLASGLTKVSFLSYVWRPQYLNRGAGASLDKVEREDEDIVEQVQLGIRSRFYQQGRYHPTQETGVHHFHQLLVSRMNT